MGDVAGRLCVLTDDMIDTAGTICAAAELLVERGATEVWAMATHGVLSGPAIDRLKNGPIERIILTNTLPLPPEKQLDKIEVLSVAPLIAEALGAVFDDTSVSDIFDGENLAWTGAGGPSPPRNLLRSARRAEHHPRICCDSFARRV